ncbi:carboxylesterase/lipase family protein [Microbacterium sp. NPDC091662]|uniref:carboxylesterase/lipase family protein n=1 Tax=Microbacterium sp. NPDC091662 TaxID=3364211 RepID=UPI0038185A01
MVAPTRRVSRERRNRALKPTVVGTTFGPVRGVRRNGIVSWRGIPYAAPPFGERRFRPPVAPSVWADPFDASAFGPAAPQQPSDGQSPVPRPRTGGDDILTLNIWSPDSTARLPVMVFIHGGAFVSGGSALPIYDGDGFARQGIVYVSINYRLGVDGFLWTGEGTPNLGLLDQVAALEWVRDNIAGFGGDPDLVTIFGESAGAMSVCTLMAMPRARGLFHRAIAQSGAGDCARTADEALRVTRKLARLLGVRPTIAALSAVRREHLLWAQAELGVRMIRSMASCRGHAATQNLMPFEPVIDGEILPALPRSALAAGESSDIDLLIGFNQDEANLFFVPNGSISKLNLLTAFLFARGYGARLHGLRRSYASRGITDSSKLALAIFTDGFYRIPALRIAQARPRTHVYEFTWQPPTFDGALGACHGLELPFVFNTLDTAGLDTLLGENPPALLASEMNRTWARFARTGKPGWPMYDGRERHSMRFDTISRLEQDTTDPRAWPVLDPW